MKAWRRKGFMSAWCDAIMDDFRDLQQIVTGRSKPMDLTEEKEWSGFVFLDKAYVTPGSVPWGHRLIPAESETLTVDLTTVPAESYRWVYARISLTNLTVGVALSTGPDKMASDPNSGMVARNLFRVYRGPDVDGQPGMVSKMLPVAWEGEIHFDGVPAP